MTINHQQTATPSTHNTASPAGGDSVTDHGVQPKTSDHGVPQLAVSGTAMRASAREPARSPQDVVPRDRVDKRWRAVESAMRRNGYRPGGLIEALHAVQRAYGFIDETAMRSLAAALGLPLSKVYGVATFYHFFRLKPKGRHTCVVCLGTACYIKGAERILQTVAHDFQVKPGETSADGQISLLTARCVGACGQAPAVVIDERVIGQGEPATIGAKLTELVSSTRNGTDHGVQSEVSDHGAPQLAASGTALRASAPDPASPQAAAPPDRLPGNGRQTP